MKIMEMVLIFMQVEINTLVSGKIITSTGKEPLLGQVEISMKVNGKTIKIMVKEHLLMRMEL